MKIRYTLPAAEELEEILVFLLGRSKSGARSVLNEVERVERLLLQFPSAGRATSAPGLRRINLPSHPYCMFYETLGPDIVVHHVRHSSRDPKSMPGQ
jgi:plasmid stabilization system protein ParE